MSSFIFDGQLYAIQIFGVGQFFRWHDYVIGPSSMGPIMHYAAGGPIILSLIRIINYLPCRDLNPVLH